MGKDLYDTDSNSYKLRWEKAWEKFAAAALLGMLTTCHFSNKAELAKQVGEYADAMMKEWEKAR